MLFRCLIFSDGEALPSRSQTKNDSTFRLHAEIALTRKEVGGGCAGAGRPREERRGRAHPRGVVPQSGEGLQTAGVQRSLQRGVSPVRLLVSQRGREPVGRLQRKAQGIAKGNTPGTMQKAGA